MILNWLRGASRNADGKSAARALAGTPALGAIAPRGGRLGGRRGLPRAPGHISLGAEDAREQAGDGQIGVQRFPMQAVARSKDLDLRELRGRGSPPILARGRAGTRRCSRWSARQRCGRPRGRSGRRRRAAQGCARSFRARWRRRFRRLSTQPWISLHRASNSSCCSITICIARRTSPRFMPSTQTSSGLPSLPSRLIFACPSPKT